MKMVLRPVTFFHLFNGFDSASYAAMVERLHELQKIHDFAVLDLRQIIVSGETGIRATTK